MSRSKSGDKSPYLPSFHSVSGRDNCQQKIRGLSWQSAATGVIVWQFREVFAMRWKVALCLLAFYVVDVQAQWIPVTVPMKLANGIPMVQVLLNNRGPYPFVLDTGATVTVIRSRLLKELQVSLGSPVLIAGSLGKATHQRSSIRSVEVAGLAVHDVEVVTMDGSPLSNVPADVQGILGENFLEDFDLLLDNDRKLLMLDRSSQLEDSLTGEHIQVSRSGIFRGAPATGKILLAGTVPDLLLNPATFLLDSAANTVLLYPLQDEVLIVSLPHYVSVESLDRSQLCSVRSSHLDMGGHRYRDLTMTICHGVSHGGAVNEGLLPTSIFHRLFLCHRNGYLIANPEKLKVQKLPAPNRHQDRELARSSTEPAPGQKSGNPIEVGLDTEIPQGRED